MKSLFAAIALVAACSVVNAAEVKKDTKAPVLTSKAMTDKDMDKVTAAGIPSSLGTGIGTANHNAGVASPSIPSPAKPYELPLQLNPGFGRNMFGS